MSLYQLKSTIINNKTVLENYVFMTVLQLLNSFFGLLVYPFVIRKLGTEAYGTYVFAFSLSIIFGYLVSFSFELLGTKEVAQNIHNTREKSYVFSTIVFSRVFLFIVALFIFCVLIFISSFIKANVILYLICFMSCLSHVFFHPWYFQAIEKMRVVTFVQVGFKLLSLPFIFLCISDESDLLLFAVIMTLSTLCGAVYAFFYLLIVEKIQLLGVVRSDILKFFKKTLPLFYSTVTGVVKGESITQVIGMYFGMHEVALYDLGKKIIAIPISLTTSINSAFFPKFAKNPTKASIDKLIKYEYLLGLMGMLAVAVLGQWAVQVLGGDAMKESYWLAVIMSVNILCYLVVNAYIHFVFILNNRNEILFQNQLISLIVMIVVFPVGLWFYKNLYVLPIAWSLSGLTELIFCYIMTRNIRRES